MTKDEPSEHRNVDLVEKNPILDRIAIFGSSGWALLASFLLLLVAIAVNAWIEGVASPTGIRFVGSKTAAVKQRTDILPMIRSVSYALSSENPNLPADALAAYQRDGVIAIRGLLSKELIEALDPASQQLVNDQQQKNMHRNKPRHSTQFHTVQLGPIFLSQEAIATPFRNVALGSIIPHIAAQLLGLNSSQSLRVMRDILLAKDKDPYVCGYHVDDTGFWPATADSPGVNAWIALDDMPTIHGGGFALAVGSHIAEYSAIAHKVTGSTKTFPQAGFKDAADMFANRSGSGTCNLKSSAPEVNRMMDGSMRVYEVLRGDVIFHDRWLFHRTVPFVDSNDPRIWRRYSVRYAPGSAVIPPGYGTEPSVLWDDGNGGRTADQVAEFDGPWYPKCWPSVSKDEMDALPNLLTEKMPKAEELRKRRQKEIKAYLNGRVTYNTN